MKFSNKMFVVYLTLAIVVLSLLVKYGILEVCGLATITLNSMFIIRHRDKVVDLANGQGNGIK